MIRRTAVLVIGGIMLAWIHGCATTDAHMPATPHAQRTPSPPELTPPQALAGLPGAYLYVYLPDNLLSVGLRVETIEAEVRNRLLQWGIRELTHNEMLATPGMPSLDVNVNGTVSASGDRLVYNVRVSLSEKVQLLRSPRAIVNTRMWDAATVGEARLDRLEDVYAAAYETADRFIADYLAAGGRPAMIAARTAHLHPAPTLLATQTSPAKPH